jgi:UPF0755 protein
MSREPKAGGTGAFAKAGKAAFVVVSLLVITAIALGLGALALATRYDEPTGEVGADGVVFTVGQGESGAAVARRLAQERVIRSELLFRLLMKARSLEHSLKAGSYRVESDMSGSRILEMIAEGRQILLRLTIPEGATSRAVALAAEAAGVASAAEVIAAAGDAELARSLGVAAGSLDGYLYPDTYFVPRDAGGAALVSLMVETFKRRVAEALPETSSLTAEELHDRVILASIVEREYRLPDEAPLMASVFSNRLRIGMALQSCATVVYVITERQDKPHPSRIFDRDLRIDDPFNTYKYPGLPPRPICNPGITAIAAAIRPAVSDYLYFRLVDEAAGEHYFSATLDEHVRAASFAVKPAGR